MLFTASEATGKNFPVAVYNLWQWLGQVILTLNVIIDYRLFSLCCCRLRKSLSFTPRSRERVETENKIFRQWVNFYCTCHWRNSNFLSPCPCKGKNSFERYKAVLSSRSFIKQRENKLPWKDENGLSRNQKVPWSGGRVGFFRVVEILFLCLVLFDKLIDALAYITCILVHRCLPMSTHAKPTEGGQKLQCCFVTNTV